IAKVAMVGGKIKKLRVCEFHVSCSRGNSGEKDDDDDEDGTKVASDDDHEEISDDNEDGDDDNVKDDYDDSDENVDDDDEMIKLDNNEEDINLDERILTLAFHEVEDEEDYDDPYGDFNVNIIIEDVEKTNADQARVALTIS
nr:hypothetical protein [Tanacetum cinerariifolium]